MNTLRRVLALGQLHADREGELDPEPDDLSRSFLGSWEETGTWGMKNGHERRMERNCGGCTQWGPSKRLNQEALPSWGVLECGGRCCHISPPLTRYALICRAGVLFCPTSFPKSLCALRGRLTCIVATGSVVFWLLMGFSDGRTPEGGGGNAGSVQQCPWVLETTSSLSAKGC